MSLVDQYDLGKRLRSRVALANYQTTHTSAAADTTQDGITIDRQDANYRHYYCAKAIVSASFQAGSSQRTAVMSLNVQHSSDGTSWDNYSTGTVPSNVTLGSSSTGGSTGTTGGNEYATIEQPVNLQMARRYVRIQLPVPTFTDCSSGNTLNVHGVMVFGGGDEAPPLTT